MILYVGKCLIAYNQFALENKPMTQRRVLSFLKSLIVAFIFFGFGRLMAIRYGDAGFWITVILLFFFYLGWWWFNRKK